MEEQEKDNKVYEFSYLLDSNISEEEARALIEKIKGIVLELKGEMSKDYSLEKINLSYPVKKQEMAYFGYFHFKLSPDSVDSFKDKIRYESSLLRYLIVSPPPASRRSAQDNEGKVEDNKKSVVEEVEDEKVEASQEEVSETVEEPVASEELPKEKSEVDGEALEHTLEEIEKIS